MTFPLGGALVGLLWPLCRFRIFAYPVSITTAIVFAGGVAVADQGVPWRWDAYTYLALVVYALIMGLAFGGSLRKAALAHRLEPDSV